MPEILKCKIRKKIQNKNNINGLQKARNHHKLPRIATKRERQTNYERASEEIPLNQYLKIQTPHPHLVLQDHMAGPEFLEITCKY
jgi:nicotinamidase-related amidase